MMTENKRKRTAAIKRKAGSLIQKPTHHGIDIEAPSDF
jgi:hypothetical protein